jgi:HEAT repeat protein
MDEDNLSWAALQSLGSLRATQYAERIRSYLRDSDAGVRLEAKRALKKLGCPVELPPLPVHLVKHRKFLSKDLEEWSANLDLENVNLALKILSECVEQGFGAKEIAEVVGVELRRVDVARG